MRFTSEQLKNHPKRDELLGLKPHQKATDVQLAETYASTGSIWKTAAQFGMAGQSVWERLGALGAITSTRFTPEQEQAIERFYVAGFKKGELDTFCACHGLLKTSVSRWARRQNLTSKQRTCSDRTISLITAGAQQRAADWQSNGSHPQGFKDKIHTDDAKQRIGTASVQAAAARSPDKESARILKMLHTKKDAGILITPRIGSWKQGWHTIGGKRIFFRSRWEVNYACYLELLCKSGNIAFWDYEPETFWFEGIKRGTTNYTPDFKIVYTDGKVEWHEVKGWMDARSRTKIKRMRKYHPLVVLRIIDSAWFKKHKSLSKTVPGWIPCRF